MSEKQRPKANVLAEIAGWYGAAAIVLAYSLVSFKVLAADGAVYQVLNLRGALGVIIIASVKKARQSVVLNIFWLVIAAAALIKLAAS